MDSLVNFRDIGGYSAKEGKKVRDGKLFRSGEVVNLTEEDQNRFMNVYKIQHIYDFRGQQEVTETPDETFPNVAYNNIDIMKDLHGKTASLSDMERMKDPDHAMMMIYEELVFSDSAQTGYREFLLDLVEHPEEASLFHCFAGKDRTGVGAGLILASLDVSEDDIFVDYLKTNEQRKATNDKLLAEFKEQGMDEAEIHRMETMLYVKKDYLEHSFALIHKNFGDIHGYLHDGLKLPKDFESELAHFYLAD